MSGLAWRYRLPSLSVLIPGLSHLKYGHDTIHIEQNNNVYKQFRQLKVDRLVGCARNHSHKNECCSRNAAATTLTRFVGRLGFEQYNISPAGIEQTPNFVGYSGHHSAQDLKKRYHVSELRPAPEVAGTPVAGTRQCVTMVDVVNYVDVSAILMLGIPVLAYTKLPAVSHDTPNSKSWWRRNHTLYTRVCGGSTYVETLHDFFQRDSIVLRRPDGQAIYVRIDVFVDPHDKTHAYVSCVPLVHIPNYSGALEEIATSDELPRLHPMILKGENGQFYTLFREVKSDELCLGFVDVSGYARIKMERIAQLCAVPFEKRNAVTAHQTTKCTPQYARCFEDLRAWWPHFVKAPLLDVYIEGCSFKPLQIEDLEPEVARVRDALRRAAAILATDDSSASSDTSRSDTVQVHPVDPPPFVYLRDRLPNLRRDVASVVTNRTVYAGGVTD